MSRLGLPTPPRLPGGLRWFPVLVVALLFVGLLLTRPAADPWGSLTGWWPFGGGSTAQSSPSVSARTASASTQPPSRSTGGAAAAPTCEFSALPPEASATAKLIRAGGPFPYPRNDGVVFHNNAKLLPAQRDGYYREYTVPTPGARARGERRLITGGTPLTSPPEWYFTGDHYESFCALVGAQ